MIDAHARFSSGESRAGVFCGVSAFRRDDNPIRVGRGQWTIRSQRPVFDGFRSLGRRPDAAKSGPSILPSSRALSITIDSPAQYEMPMPQ